MRGSVWRWWNGLFGPVLVLSSYFLRLFSGSLFYSSCCPLKLVAFRGSTFLENNYVKGA